MSPLFIFFRNAKWTKATPTQRLMRATGVRAIENYKKLMLALVAI